MHTFLFFFAKGEEKLYFRFAHKHESKLVCFLKRNTHSNKSVCFVLLLCAEMERVRQFCIN